MHEKSKGRGAQSNESSRFLDKQLVPAYGEESEEQPLLRTQFLKDHSKTVVNENRSPDLSFRYSLNPYRGCEHGCAYCYARPTHEYFGMSAGLDFESKILVKENAAQLLRKRMMSSSWEPAPIFMSGVTDCYQPAERKFEITRSCLKILLEFRNPVALITKNFLVTRDIDLLKELATFQAIRIYLSVTTLRADLVRTLEPRTSTPGARLKAIELLAKAGIPVGVNVAPCIPGLTDHEMPGILKAAKEAGATSAGFIPVRLPYSVKSIFSEWLEANYPDSNSKVLNAIRAIRGGELNDAEFGSRMTGEGVEAENLQKLFGVFSKKYGLNETTIVLSTAHFQRPGAQLKLF